MKPQEYLDQHGISEKSVEKFGLILDHDKITFPIRDIEGTFCYNKYRHLSENAAGKFSFDKGSQTSLYNVEALKNGDYVFIVEGEPDCIRLDQEGIVAVTNTSGSSTFKKEWAEHFFGKRVYVLYDNDEAGKTGASKVKDVLPSAIIITLPEEFKDICEYFLKHSKKDFQRLVKEQTQKGMISYKDLCDVFDKWLLLTDKNVMKIMLATIVSHYFATDPLWMFLVAPPSGSKTEIISSVINLPLVYFLSDLTVHTLASGMPAKKDRDPSLLTRLPNNILVMKDFTTVLSMRHEEKQQILSQLREIYDGRFSKEFGTGKRVDWEGRLTLLAGVTPIVDTHSSVFQVMGERFVMYRVPQAAKIDVAKKALSNYGGEKQMRQEMAEAMSKYFFSLKIPEVSTIQLPEEIINALASLASFVVTARSGVVRDQYRRDLTYIPETEAPSRLAKQLGTLIKALCVLDKRSVVNWDDYYLTLRVALDIIPANRSKHLGALCGELLAVTTAKVGEKTSYSKSGSEIILEDLTALGLVTGKAEGHGIANEWMLSELSYSYFKDIVPKTSKALTDVFPVGGPYEDLIKEMLEGKPTEYIEEEQRTLDHRLKDF